MSLRARADLASAAARVTALWARERLTPIRPVAPGEVPPNPEALTPEWLTDALCGGHPGAEVTGSMATTQRSRKELAHIFNRS